MAQPHWALKNIFYSVTATGVEIKVWTFQPCHLWMRWTLTYPQEHLVPVISRGVAIYSDKRFCFVSYHDNEQAEGDDTYIHTFLKEPWAHCETRFFYFHGRMGSERSPSTSAIFKYHRVAPVEPELQEKHDSPLDMMIDLALGSENAQSFTPQVDYAISKLEVPLMKAGVATNGLITVQLRTNDVRHPSEVVLWQDTINATDLPVLPAWQWFSFPVSGVLAQTDVPLWIVIFWTEGTYWWAPPYIKSDSSDLYLRGERLSRPIAGAWVGYGLGIDLGFITWGI